MSNARLLLPIYLLVGLSRVAFFADFDGSNVLKCDWAQAYPVNEIPDDEAAQREIMLLASHWEGKFGHHGIGADLDKGIMLAMGLDTDIVTGNGGCLADYETGQLHSCDNQYLDITWECEHVALLAMALNGSTYANEFFQSVMEGYWNGTVQTFIIDQLQKKITFYETINDQLPGLGGIFTNLNWNGTQMQQIDRFPYMLFDTIGRMAWPMLAVHHLLNRTSNSPLGIRYKQFADMIARNALTIFYQGNGVFTAAVTIFDLSQPPSPDNYEPAPIGLSIWPFAQELSLYYCYFYADWTTYGDETEKRKMWPKLKANIKSVNYPLDEGIPVVVELGILYSAAERFKYLYLPYLDIPEDEQLHLTGEVVRTHNSVIRQRIPGLYTSGWRWNEPYDYVEERKYCGIQDLGFFKAEQFCQNQDLICPSGAFSLILQPKTRGIGLAWYVTMLQSMKMQSPFGSLACSEKNGDFISMSLKWDSKLLPLLAFDGGIASTIRAVLAETNTLDEFYAIAKDNIAIFDDSNQNFTVEPYMPVGSLNAQDRFNACSAEVYERPQSSARPTVTPEKGNSWLLIGVGSGSVVLITTAVILLICCLMRRRAYKHRNTASDGRIHSKRYGNMRAMGNEWEVKNSALTVEKEPLGKGAFAVVFKGCLKELPPVFHSGGRPLANVNWLSDPNIIVAVKCPSSEIFKNEFTREIELMKAVDYHPHLVNMLGCITNTEEPKLLLEYCGNGDLLQYLQKIKEPSEPNTSGNLPAYDFNRLLSFAWQVNDAMIYLSSKNHVHRDLSARNVLLTDEYLAKISDFGLTRTMVNDEYKSKGGLLPFRILSPEALIRMQFSSKSDVWAFGILLYELFSLGETPYSDIQETGMLRFLSSGGRLERPEYATDPIYRIMQSCWQFEADERPSFHELGSLLSAEMELNPAAYSYLLVPRPNY